jgi:endoglucanase
MLHCKIDLRTSAAMTYSSRRHFLRYGAAGIGLGLQPFTLAAGNAAASHTGTPSRLLFGVNIAGAEFEAIGGRWRWPSLTNLAYYLGKGFTVFRIPFRWERLQPELRGPLPEEALQGLDAIIAAINAQGAIAILDAHNYGRREKTIIGGSGSPVSAADFADFWGRMAARYKAQPLVWYNLMNEPHDMPAQANLEAQNAACLAIRKAGARAKVLFSGNAWTGAHSWIKSGNGAVMLGARDPADNYAFDVHQYLDPGFGGSGPKPVLGVGAHILAAVTIWARAHRKKLFLGEFGGGPSQAFLTELDSLLAYVVANKDVFIGATYFAGGGGWGRNPGSTDPVDGVEKPQIQMLEEYLKI